MDLDATIRFSAVADAIGTTQKALRNWLQRNRLALYSPQPEGGSWRAFQLNDVLLLAVTNNLVRFGIKVNWANKIARNLVDEKEKWLTLLAQGPENVFECNNLEAVYLWPGKNEEDDWQYTSFLIADGIPWYLADCALTIQPGVIMFHSLERLIEAGVI